MNLWKASHALFSPQLAKTAGKTNSTLATSLAHVGGDPISEWSLLNAPDSWVWCLPSKPRKFIWGTDSINSATTYGQKLAVELLDTVSAKRVPIQNYIRAIKYDRRVDRLVRLKPRLYIHDKNVRE